MRNPRLAFGVAVLVLTLILAGIGAGYMYYETNQSNKELREQTENSKQEVETEVEESSGDTVSEEQEQNEVFVTVDKGDSSPEIYHMVPLADESTFAFLKRLDEQSTEFMFTFEESASVGAYITSMNGYEPQDDEFWKFIVNEKDSAEGISTYKVKKGDKIKFVIDEIKL